MRNPFQTVYCEDCEWCMLATDYNDLDKQVEYARCKAHPKAYPSCFRHNFKTEYGLCEFARDFRFCFKFKPKDEM